MILVGDVYAISLGGSGYAYCRVLGSLLTEFFDRRTSDAVGDVDVVHAPVAFTIWVSKAAFADRKWQWIGNATPGLKPPPVFFKQDPITKRLSLYQNGRERPATFEECKHLECASVWAANHVEDRLRNHFTGGPCKWVQSLRPKAAAG